MYALCHRFVRSLLTYVLVLSSPGTVFDHPCPPIQEGGPFNRSGIEQTRNRKPSSTRVANKQKLDLRALELRDIISTVYAYHGNNFELVSYSTQQPIEYQLTTSRLSRKMLNWSCSSSRQAVTRHCWPPKPTQTSSWGVLYVSRVSHLQYMISPADTHSSFFSGSSSTLSETPQTKLPALSSRLLLPLGRASTRASAS